MEAILDQLPEEARLQYEALVAEREQLAQEIIVLKEPQNTDDDVTRQLFKTPVNTGVATTSGGDNTT